MWFIYLFIYAISLFIFGIHSTSFWLNLLIWFYHWFVISWYVLLTFFVWFLALWFFIRDYKIMWCIYLFDSFLVVPLVHPSTFELILEASYQWGYRVSAVMIAGRSQWCILLHNIIKFIVFVRCKHVFDTHHKEETVLC